MSLKKQARSRAALERAVRRYAALRGALGKYGAEFPVTLRDGTQATARVVVTFTAQEPRP